MTTLSTKIDLKKRKKIEERQQKRDERAAKNKKREKKQAVARHAFRQERADLIADLQNYQLNSTAYASLQPTVVRQPKKGTEAAQEAKREPKFPKKLRAISAQSQSDERAKRLRKEEVYYETGSSCTESDEDDADEEDEPRSAVAPQETNSTAPVGQKCIPNADQLRALNQAEFPERVDVANAPRIDTNPAEAKTAAGAAAEFCRLLAHIKGVKVAVHRVEAAERQRAELPISAEEQIIVETINENTVTIITGETGSGKTTQVPQFLYEAGYTSNGHLIGVTEPRRVAAMSMSERVGVELNAPAVASYQIRFEGNRTDETRVLFMTDGVLLKELQADVKLSKFSVIIIDEAHERSMYSDVLVGLLARICVQRARQGTPLKVVIMSATLRISDFMQSRLFPATLPKLLNVSARQYEVSVHFERSTPADYMKAAIAKVRKIHERLPEGAILVFVSGQKEVHRLVRVLTHLYATPSKEKLKSHTRRAQKRPHASAAAHKATTNQEQDEGPDDDDGDIETIVSLTARLQAMNDQIDCCLSDFDKMRRDENALIGIDGLDAADAADDLDSDDNEEDGEVYKLVPMRSADPSKRPTPLHCLPLYSMMPSFLQKRVFEPPPIGHRLCVVATNVAETSLTIPNVRYVVDTGREKRRDFDPVTGVSQFRVTWVSQASADQRSGRAGRVGPGHVYRLYSSAVYADFMPFPPPEILHKPIEQVVLHLKSMNIRRIANFPFPTPPAADQVAEAERRLQSLGALGRSNEQEARLITPLGRLLLTFPLSPAFSKILVLALQNALGAYALSLVSALSVREPLVNVAALEGADNAETQSMMALMLKQRRSWTAIAQARRLGDLQVLLSALRESDRLQTRDRASAVRLGLRYEALKEIRKMRRQLAQLINASPSLRKIVGDVDVEAHLGGLKPTDAELSKIRQIFVSCQPEHIARRVESGEQVPKGAYKTQLLEEYVYIDPTSSLYEEAPKYVLYQEIVQITDRRLLQGVCECEEAWLKTGIVTVDCYGWK